MYVLNGDLFMKHGSNLWRLDEFFSSACSAQHFIVVLAVNIVLKGLKIRLSFDVTKNFKILLMFGILPKNNLFAHSRRAFQKSLKNSLQHNSEKQIPNIRIQTSKQLTKTNQICSITIRKSTFPALQKNLFNSLSIPK